jgi:hypothetical protein
MAYSKANLKISGYLRRRRRRRRRRRQRRSATMLS